MLKRLRLRRKSPLRKWLAALLIGLLAAAVAWTVSRVPPMSGSVRAIDTAFYDAFYRLREPEDRTGGPIVIIAVDQESIDTMAGTENAYRWPWPRECWGMLLGYLEQCGAKIVVFDLLFEEPSGYQREFGDDDTFAAALDASVIPVVHSLRAEEVSNAPFAPPVQRSPRFGAVNVIEGAVVRSYEPFVNHRPSLAVEAVRAADSNISSSLIQPFLLHYYGPHRTPNEHTTFRYVRAIDMVMMAVDAAPISAELRSMFKDKIVLIGATADATFDLKSSPLSAKYPGVEIHATAMQNLLENRRVRVIGGGPTFAIGLLAALLAATGAVLPRLTSLKLVLSAGSVAALFLIAYVMFTTGWEIRWLPVATPLLGAAGATVAGLGWTYLVEDRQRRTLLKFLAQYVSPEVAAELDRRGEISLGGLRREMTVMFTDIAGFTDLSETMPVEKLETFMNFYLSEMSSVVFECNGTLDKYIGDAIMSFWNAPLDQPDHAVLACRAALGIRDRETALRQQIAQVGAPGIRTRIGINTGPMVVGNMGSMQKVNYTVLGDAVNLASRLEAANKIYGSHILVAQPTIDLVRDQFIFRKLDLLRVKGRKQPMAVYELLAEANGDESLHRLARDFEAAFDAYQHRDWETAERTLLALASNFPDDQPITVLLERVRAHRASPPPHDWDGVHVAKEK